MFDGEAWAAGEVVVFMLIAGLIGFALGWILGRWSQRGHIASDYEEQLAAERERARRVEDRLNQSSRDLEGAQLQLKGGEGRIDELAGELASTKEDVAELEAALAAAAGKDAEIERLAAELAQREATVSELEAALAPVPDEPARLETPTEVEPGQPAPVEAARIEATVATPAEAPSKEEGLAMMAEIAARTAGGGPVVEDDLKNIRGIGPVIERTLKSLGITSFKQIANFAATDIAYVSAALDAFPGRIERDDWMSSASELHQQKYGE